MRVRIVKTDGTMLTADSVTLHRGGYVRADGNLQDEKDKYHRDINAVVIHGSQVQRLEKGFWR